MRRVLLATAVGLAVLGSLASSSTASGHRAKIELRKTRLGKILVDSAGYTIYAFTPDKRNHDSCQNRTGCLSVWPAVVSGGTPIAGPGVKQGLLGTIKLRGGGRQVTYAGHALYTYVADSKPGQTSYVNILQFRGRWPALDARGHEVK